MQNNNMNKKKAFVISIVIDFFVLLVLYYLLHEFVLSDTATLGFFIIGVLSGSILLLYEYRKFML